MSVSGALAKTKTHNHVVNMEPITSPTYVGWEPIMSWYDRFHKYCLYEIIKWATLFFKLTVFSMYITDVLEFGRFGNFIFWKYGNLKYL